MLNITRYEKAIQLELNDEARVDFDELVECLFWDDLYLEVHDQVYIVDTYQGVIYEFDNYYYAIDVFTLESVLYALNDGQVVGLSEIDSIDYQSLIKDVDDGTLLFDIACNAIEEAVC